MSLIKATQSLENIAPSQQSSPTNEDPSSSSGAAPFFELLLPAASMTNHPPRQDSSQQCRCLSVCYCDTANLTNKVLLSRPSSPSSGIPILSQPSFYRTSCEEANEILNFFRDKFTPRYPFVVVPQDVSAKELYRVRPFLYTAIFAICNRDSVQQKEAGKLVMKQLAERLFVKMERSLDLLLGVLVYAGGLVTDSYYVPVPLGVEGERLTLLVSAATIISGISQI